MDEGRVSRRKAFGSPCTRHSRARCGRPLPPPPGIPATHVNVSQQVRLVVEPKGVAASRSHLEEDDAGKVKGEAARACEDGPEVADEARRVVEDEQGGGGHLDAGRPGGGGASQYRGGGGGAGGGHLDTGGEGLYGGKGRHLNAGVVVGWGGTGGFRCVEGWV